MPGNINNKPKDLCTGCGACLAACPHGAVSMSMGDSGFQEAVVADDKCTGCGMCTKACPKFLQPLETAEYMDSLKENGNIYMGVSRDDSTRKKTSSGGIAMEMARAYLNKGYKICGVAYNTEKHRAEHIIVNTEKDLERIRGSKYLQSSTSEAFSRFRKGEGYVVFGTPCQIYGLRKHLQSRKMEDDFILVDFFCHGVPSYLLWDKYLEYIGERYGINIKSIKNVDFKDKKHGWHNYSMRISGEKSSYLKSMEDDVFYDFFLSDMCLNKPCFNCTFRHDQVYSDIRLGDFWGPKYKHDEKGVSIVISNTEKGNNVIQDLKEHCIFERVSAEDILVSQPHRFVKIPYGYERVMKMLESDIPLKQIYKKVLMKKHIRRKAVRTMKRLIPRTLRKKVKSLLKST